MQPENLQRPFSAPLSDAAMAQTAPAPPQWKVVERLGELSAVRGPWEQLRSQSPLKPPNADPDRFAVVTQHLESNATPYVAVLGGAGGARAMVIGRVSRRPVLTQVGYYSLKSPQMQCLDVVYGGVLTEDTDCAVKAVGSMLSELLIQGRFDHIMVNHLPASHGLRLALAPRTVVQEPHWQMELALGSYAETLHKYGHQFRKKIAKHDRVFERDAGGVVELQEVTTVEQALRFLSEAAEICDGTYKRSFADRIRDDALGRAVYRLEAELGRLRCFLLCVNKRPVAYQAGVIFGSTYFAEGRGYLPMWAKLRPGNVLFWRVVRRLSELGVATIDFGFGDGEHKRVCATRRSEEATLQYYGRGSKAQLWAAVDVSTRALARSARAILSKFDMTDTLKRTWRSWSVGLAGRKAREDTER